MAESNRQLWRYDANQEGLLTGVFFATEQEIADVAGVALDHAEFGVIVVEPDDFSLIASDYIGSDDSEFIDAMIVRGAVAGFNPIMWIEAGSYNDDDEWIVTRVDDEGDGPSWGLPDDDEDDDFDDDEDY